ncbi:MAG: LytTR family transcriptional regulator DNA-binding domain-containing protein [Bacteroidota bacterium]
MKWWLGKDSWYVAAASVLLGFFIISLGQTDIPALFLDARFYPDLFFVSLIHFVVIYYLVVAHRWVETKYPLRSHGTKSMGLHLLTGVLLPALLSLALAYAYLEGVLHYRIEETSFFYYEYPVSVVIIVAINLVLTILTLLSQTAKPAAAPPGPEKKKTLILSQGDLKVPVQLSEVACILKEGDFAVVFAFDGRQFIISESLDETFTALDTELFFRANRQGIVNRNACGPFQVNRSGKIDLQLRFPEGRVLSISQKRAPDFKTWLKAT